MPNYDALYRGSVTDRTDPEARGRVRVLLPALFGDTPTDWAEPTSATADLPALRAQVWVLFQGGDERRPVYISGAPPTQVISPLPTNLVTTDTAQNITGLKTFGTSGLIPGITPLGTVNGTDVAVGDLFVLRKAFNGTNSPNFSVAKSRGTGAVPLVTLINDVLGVFSYRGFDGTNFIQAVQLKVVQDTVSATGKTPASFIISLADPTTGTLTDRVIVTSAGVMSINGQTVVVTNDTRLTADQIAGTASIRTLGAGAQQAAAGTHAHTGASATDVEDAKVLSLMGVL